MDMLFLLSLALGDSGAIGLEELLDWDNDRYQGEATAAKPE